MGLDAAENLTHNTVNVEANDHPEEVISWLPINLIYNDDNVEGWL